MESSFEELGVSTPIVKALNEHGYKNPFPIQQEVYTNFSERSRYDRSSTYRDW